MNVLGAVKSTKSTALPSGRGSQTARSAGTDEALLSKHNLAADLMIVAPLKSRRKTKKK